VHIYVAGPLTDCGQDAIDAAIDAAQTLRELGHYPFVPHVHTGWDERHPASWDTWMDWCLCWLSRCDALLRLPGASPGADREVEYASYDLRIPVYHSLKDVPPA